MYTINLPAIAPSAAHNFSVKTIEFKMAAVSVKRSNVNLTRPYISQGATTNDNDDDHDDNKLNVLSLS